MSIKDNMLNTEFTDEGGVRFRAPVNRSGYYFKGCEVCWTCLFFDGMTMDCCTSRLFPTSPGGREHISDPEWFRCALWREKEE